MKKNNKFINFIINKRTISLLAIISAILFTYLVYSLNVLPTKYFILVVLLIVLVVGLPIFLMFYKHKGKKTKTGLMYFYKIISILLSFLLIGLSFVMAVSKSSLEEWTGVTEVTDRYAIYVHNDSDIHELEDLNNAEYKVGMNTTLSYETIKEIETKIYGDNPDNLTFEKYSDFTFYINAYKDREIDAIILNNAMIEKMEASDEYKELLKNSRKIFEMEVVNDLSDSFVTTNVTEESFNVFISGADYFDGMEVSLRSDVNMIATVNPKTRTVLLTSIPRDTLVDIPEWNGVDKLTHTGVWGVERTSQVLSELFGIEIHHYVRLNFSSFMTLVDAIGGITIDNPVEFTDDYDRYLFEEGTIQLTGEEALAYARERHNVTDGDTGRVQNQQRVIKGIIDKLLSPSILLNYSSFLNSLEEEFETSLTYGEISSIVKQQIDLNSEWTILNQHIDTYSSTSYKLINGYGSELNIAIAYEDSIEEASQIIKDVMDGKEVEISTEKPVRPQHSHNWVPDIIHHPAVEEVVEIIEHPETEINVVVLTFSDGHTQEVDQSMSEEYVNNYVETQLVEGLEVTLTNTSEPTIRIIEAWSETVVVTEAQEAYDEIIGYTCSCGASILNKTEE